MPKINKTYLIIGFIVLIVAAVWYNSSKQPAATANETAAAELKTITQEVSVTGKIKPAEQIDLAFEKSGKISRVNAAIGSIVAKNTILAVMESNDIDAQLSQAQAVLEAEQAKLKQLKQGTRPEQVQISATKVISAQKTLSDAENTFQNVKQKADNDLANLYDKTSDILTDASAKADAAVNTTIADLFLNAAGNNPQLTFSIANQQVKIDCESKRITAGKAVEAIKNEISNLTANSPLSQPELDKSLGNIKIQLIVIQDFLAKTNEAVNVTIGLSSTVSNTYKSAVDTASASVNTAITNINNHIQAISAQKNLNKNNIDTAEASVNSAKNALASADDQLALDKAGSTPEQIAAQAAQVKQAEASIQNIQSQLAKTILTSPINGIITKQDAKIGEIVSMNTVLISLISEAKFQIETNIPEADIAKIKIGDPAKITLDAYGNDVIFEAKVISIDPAETVIEGVSTYKTTLEFTKEDDHIKSGMTANIDILTAKKENAIAIPQRAVINKNGQKFILIDAGNNQTEERKIETGLRGSDGNIEIISGLTPGEKVIISVTQ